MVDTTYYRVRRRFLAGEVPRLPGEVLDVGTWPVGRARQLADQRLIEPIPYEAPEAVVCRCKRAWSPDMVKVVAGTCPAPDLCVDVKVVAEQITETIEAPMSKVGKQTQAAYKRRTATTAAASKE